MAENKVFEGVLGELGERTKRQLEVRRSPLADKTVDKCQRQDHKSPTPYSASMGPGSGREGKKKRKT